MTGEFAPTFEALQLLEQGQFQELGDELLPWSFPELQHLKPHGLSKEGKTRKGVPDSYVGPTPSEAVVAVEYTTQATDLPNKLEADYSSVREKCPHVATVILCTNRLVPEGDMNGLRTKAKADGIRLEIVDGSILARILGRDRQDIRQRRLRIPIGAHTLPSLLARLADSVATATAGRSAAIEQGRFLPRFRVDVRFFERTRRDPAGTTLFQGDAGEGKSSWSIDYARRFALVQPTVWLTAHDLSGGTSDPLGEAVALAAYGCTDAARLPELALLLRREKQHLLVFIDGADECRDYRRFERALRVLRLSALGDLAHVILCCRTESARLLQDALKSLLPEAISQQATLHIGPLGDNERKKLLAMLGVSQNAQRSISAHLSKAQLGNPLLLEMALALQRTGALERSGADLIATAASHFIEDVCERLRENGRAPNSRHVERLLISLAEALSSAGGSGIDEEYARGLTGDAMTGENSVIERLLQTPLLVRTASGISFGHALFLEHFLELALLAHPERIAAAATDFRQAERVARRAPIAAETIPALCALAEVWPTTACILMARGLDAAPIGDTAFGAISSLLKSRFPSDVRRGLRLLRAIPSERSQKIAVEWFNSLDVDARRDWVFDAADTFFGLQVPAAASIASHAYPFRITWFEPSSVRRIEELSQEFRQALRQHARGELARGVAHAREASMNILALLRDDLLTEYLSGELERGLLDETAHHALVFLNTSAAIALYARSISKTLAAFKSGEASGASEDELNRLWGTIVPHTSDLIMLPHEALLGLVRDLLNSEDFRTVAVGAEWSRLLQEAPLFPAHAAAVRRFPNSMLALTSNLGPLLASLTASEVRALFETSAIDAKRQLVHCVGDIPRPGLEGFLLERLAEPDFRFSAIQSLRRLGAVSAAPSIAAFLNDGDDEIRKMAVRTLGGLRYLPAAPRLAEMLAASRDADEEYCLVQALGSLGTPESVASLERHFGTARNKGEVLGALLYLGLESGVAAAERLTEDQTLWPLLIPAIASIGGRSGFAEALDGSGVPRQPHEMLISIKSPILLDRIVHVAKERLQVPVSFMDETLRAVSRVDLPKTTGFLRAVASRTPLSTEALRVLGKPDLKDPSLEARSLLVKRGDQQYALELLTLELEQIQRSPHLLGDRVQSLARYPRLLVRKLLHESIERGQFVVASLRLLSYFLNSEDRTLLQALELHEDISVADEAHRALESLC
jgi:hypothetical protein